MKRHYCSIRLIGMWLFSKRKCLLITVTITFFIILLPNSGFGSYGCIEKEDILVNLHYGTAKNFSSDAIGDCEYRDILYDDSTLSPGMPDGDLFEVHSIKEGGEYAPLECKPKFSTAIIVPYRDRAKQLRSFLIYMHKFLRRQRIHYRIFIVEQVDSRPFNRAKLLNIGAVAAMRAGFPCLVQHDIDLLPLRPANLYACTKLPRHMSSMIDKLRFVLLYLDLFGGVTAMPAKQYKDVNGMSNVYFGWGCEDDDLQIRLEAHGVQICRFGPDISRYHMMNHRLQPRMSSSDTKNRELLNHTTERMKVDGLNSLQYTEVANVLQPLFTHIMVDI